MNKQIFNSNEHNKVPLDFQISTKYLEEFPPNVFILSRPNHKTPISFKKIFSYFIKIHPQLFPFSFFASCLIKITGATECVVRSSTYIKLKKQIDVGLVISILWSKLVWGKSRLIDRGWPKSEWRTRSVSVNSEYEKYAKPRRMTRKFFRKECQKIKNMQIRICCFYFIFDTFIIWKTFFSIAGS